MIAIEKDRRAADVLAGLTDVAGDRLRLIEADAMQSAIWEMGTTPPHHRQFTLQYSHNIINSLATPRMHSNR